MVSAFLELAVSNKGKEPQKSSINLYSISISGVDSGVTINVSTVVKQALVMLTLYSPGSVIMMRSELSEVDQRY